MRIRSLVTLAALALSSGGGCAAERPHRRAAHAAFVPDAYGEAWDRATRALESDGFTIAMRDRGNGILATNDRELQAPCGAESCLSRDRVFVRLTGAGQAVVNIEREHWDPAERRWSPSSDATSIAAVEKTQVDLLRAIVTGEVALRASARGEPCRDGDDCQRGLACLTYRCRDK